MSRRFDLAIEAIRTFHTGVSEDVLLKQKELEELRTKLLRRRASSIESSKRSFADRRTSARSKPWEAPTMRSADCRTRLDRRRKAWKTSGAAWPYVSVWQLTPHDPVRVPISAGQYKPSETCSPRPAVTPKRSSPTSARTIFAALAREGRGTEVWGDISRCDRDIGKVNYDAGKPAEALPALERASAAFESLQPAERSKPENQAELARTLASICLVLRQTGRMSEAITTYRRLIEILEGLIRSEPTTEYLADLATFQVGLGQVYRQIGRRTEALDIHRRAAATRERVAKSYPTISSFQVQLANVHNSLGNVLEELGRPEEAVAAMERAAEIYEPLVKANPTAIQMATNQATILKNLGLFQAQAGHLDEARKSYDRSLTISRKLLQDYPTVPQFRSNYASAASWLAEASNIEW